VRKLRIAAPGAVLRIHRLRLEVSPALPLPLLGNSSLRYRHELLLRFVRSSKGLPARIQFLLGTLAAVFVPIDAAVGTKPLTSRCTNSKRRLSEDQLLPDGLRQIEIPHSLGKWARSFGLLDPRFPQRDEEKVQFFLDGNVYGFQTSPALLGQHTLRCQPSQEISACEEPSLS